MTVSNMVTIGKDAVDITRPCDVATALKKVQLSLSVGGVAETIRLDGEEVTFQRGSDSRLAKLITKYEAECARTIGSSGGGASARQRYAKRFRFT